PVRRLAALIETDARGTAGLAARLRLSNAERDRLIALASGRGSLAPALAETEIRKLAYRIGAAPLRDLALLDWARAAAAASGDAPDSAADRAGWQEVWRVVCHAHPA